MVEVLLAVAVLSLSMGGIAAGMLVSTRSSSDNLARASAINALAAVAEDLKVATYVPCVTTEGLAAVVGGDRQLDDGRTVAVSVDSVRYWRGDPTPGTFAVGGCTTTAGPLRDGGAQLVSLTATAGGASVSGSVVVRNPAATP